MAIYLHVLVCGDRVSLLLVMGDGAWWRTEGGGGGRGVNVNHVLVHNKLVVSAKCIVQLAPNWPSLCACNRLGR